MARRIEERLRTWLAEGRTGIGQIVIELEPPGYALRHVDDAKHADLEIFRGASAALDLARFNQAQEYRPLKTAPDLRRGWRLQLETLEELVLALDYFYPAMLGCLRAAEDGSLPITPLRETLARQSGMYAITRKATVEDAESVMAWRCADQSGCLKKILWTVEDTPPAVFPPDKFRLPRTGPLPMPCAEGCNLLVAALRKHLKKSA